MTVAMMGMSSMLTGVVLVEEEFYVVTVAVGMCVRGLPGMRRIALANVTADCSGGMTL
jgi:hypothetical protein